MTDEVKKKEVVSLGGNTCNILSDDGLKFAQEIVSLNEEKKKLQAEMKKLFASYKRKLAELENRASELLARHRLTAKVDDD